MKIRCRKWEKCWGDEKKKRGGGRSDLKYFQPFCRGEKRNFPFVP